MATPEFLQDYAKDYAAQSKGAYSVPIDTSTFTGGQDASGNRLTGTAVTGANPFVAGEDALQTQAIGLAQQGVGAYQPYLTAAQQAQTNAGNTIGGLGAFQTGAQGYQTAQAGATGANAYQPFMSPYQSQVIDATLSEFDRSRLGGQQNIRDAAVNSGNFGGGREGAMMGQYNADSLADRSALQASMLNQGFGNAQAAANQNFANQGALFNMQNQQNLSNQGIAGAYGNQINQQFGLSDFNRTGMGQDINALGSLGALNQGQQQAYLSADQQQAQTGAYEPYGRLNQYGNMLTGLAGGMQGQQYQQDQASDPYASALGGLTGIAGLYGQMYGNKT